VSQTIDFTSLPSVSIEADVQDQIVLLRDLQEFDLQIEEIQNKTGVLREALDELTAIHSTLHGSLEAQRAQLGETRALMRDKEIELETNEERYNQSKGKLNHVSNTREYNALEREMDALRKMRLQLEGERDSLRDAVEEFEADVSEKAEKTAGLERQIGAEEAEITKQSSGASGEIQALKNKRDKLKKDLPKRLTRRYDFIASRRPGPAVVGATEGCCSGCNMRMPPQMFNELQIGAKMIQCPTCQRILFFVPAPVSDDALESTLEAEEKAK
jgi:predicted  nucleic acid-binding Zn-ribbon protein